jgi:hypothetical protein
LVARIDKSQLGHRDHCQSRLILPFLTYIVREIWVTQQQSSAMNIVHSSRITMLYNTVRFSPSTSPAVDMTRSWKLYGYSWSRELEITWRRRCTCSIRPPKYMFWASQDVDGARNVAPGKLSLSLPLLSRLLLQKSYPAKYIIIIPKHMLPSYSKNITSQRFHACSHLPLTMSCSIPSVSSICVCH